MPAYSSPLLEYLPPVMVVSFLGLDGDVEWQIVDSEPEEISGGAMDEIDGG